MTAVHEAIAKELNVKSDQVATTIALLDEGATVPFIARYRKEKTGGLDDTQLRYLDERLKYLRELNDRRESVLKEIDAQGKLDDTLKQKILEADTKTRLEDLYLPFKKKRKTKAQAAKEAGLEPLADQLLSDPTLTPEVIAAEYLNADANINSAADALEGARQIIMERLAEDADLIQTLRQDYWSHGIMISSQMTDAKDEGEKFKDYYDYREAIASIPSHRALALFRGQREGCLTLKTQASPAENSDEQAIVQIAQHANVTQEGRAADAWLQESVRWAWKIKIQTRLDLDVKNELRQKAELEAIRVFALNLKELLMAAPAGNKSILGLDPGLRTGVKVAAISHTGQLLETATIYPHAPQKQWDKSLQILEALCKKHSIQLIAIGNGTASRETDQLAADLIKALPGLTKIMVSEAGASIYSASEFASKELPDVDVSLRGAASIARRLQDPLAELVKIDPKSIGVGQYQHDVNQSALSQTLNGVVEDCVNAVGVDVNTASAPLLKQVAGLSNTVASNIVSLRDKEGEFKSRVQLKKVPQLGDKAFEQCAGFLRVRNAENPLDNSAVHPEAYPLVARIAESLNCKVQELIGDSTKLKSINAKDFSDEQFGIPTILDVLAELEKPGRDPRGEFKTATFREGVEDLKDLEVGMSLEGVVTNVTNFGAFVDIGVHQDGLVHISELADRFVKDPHTVVKTGDIVKARVLEVDLKRKRISLSMKSASAAQGPKSEQKPRQDAQQKTHQKLHQKPGHKVAQKPREEKPDGSLGAALLAAGLNRK